MHWILQENLINPVDLARFEKALEAKRTPFSRVKLVPVFHELADTLPVVDGPVFVYGSTGLGYVSKRCGWNPGYFDHNLDYELMLGHYGERALNHGAVCAPLGELVHRWDTFFIRPVLDTKSFAGTVMTWPQLDEFRHGVQRVADHPDATLRLTDRVVMAPLVEIQAEWRFFVVDGDIVTGSRYKVGDHLDVSSEVPPAVLWFAQSCVKSWVPNKAFTLDISANSQGLKVIEVNSANSAGVYACDVSKFVEAVNTRLLS
jgi:ATP-grasp domain, R2K clade family 3